jgi:hypothetical protein
LTSNSVIQVETLDAAAAGVGGNSEVTITILFTTNFYIYDINSIAFGSKHSIYDRILDDIILYLYERRFLEFSRSSTIIIIDASSYPNQVFYFQRLTDKIIRGAKIQLI